MIGNLLFQSGFIKNARKDNQLFLELQKIQGFGIQHN